MAKPIMRKYLDLGLAMMAALSLSLLLPAAQPQTLDRDKAMELFSEACIECSNETEITESQFGDVYEMKAFEAQEAKCFRACVGETLNLFNWTSSVGLNVDVAYGLGVVYAGSDPGKTRLFKLVVDKCTKPDAVKLTGEKCQDAENINTCFREGMVASSISTKFVQEERCVCDSSGEPGGGPPNGAKRKLKEPPLEADADDLENLYGEVGETSNTGGETVNPGGGGTVNPGGGGMANPGGGGTADTGGGGTADTGGGGTANAGGGGTADTGGGGTVNAGGGGTADTGGGGTPESQKPEPQ